MSHSKAESAFEDYMLNIEDLTVMDDCLLESKNQQDSINALLRLEYENAIAKLEKREKDVMTLYMNERISFEEYEKLLILISI